MTSPSPPASPLIPFYTPTQPKANTCVHCWFNPRASLKNVAFYEYPCGKKHLAHEKCFQVYLKSSLTANNPCRMCQREFGIINPIQQEKSIIVVQSPIAHIVETPEQKEEKKKILKTRIVLSFIVLFVIGIALLLIFTL